MAVVAYQDCLRGCIEDRGTGTATMQANIAQRLAYLEQAPLYGIFLDSREAYNATDQDRCLVILKGYGVGPNMLQLIKHF